MRAHEGSPRPWLTPSTLTETMRFVDLGLSPNSPWCEHNRRCVLKDFCCNIMLDDSRHNDLIMTYGSVLSNSTSPHGSSLESSVAGPGSDRRETGGRGRSNQDGWDRGPSFMKPISPRETASDMCILDHRLLANHLPGRWVTILAVGSCLKATKV